MVIEGVQCRPNGQTHISGEKQTRRRVVNSFPAKTVLSTDYPETRDIDIPFQTPNATQTYTQNVKL